MPQGARLPGPEPRVGCVCSRGVRPQRLANQPSHGRGVSGWLREQGCLLNVVVVDSCQCAGNWFVSAPTQGAECVTVQSVKHINVLQFKTDRSVDAE